MKFILEVGLYVLLLLIPTLITSAIKNFGDHILNQYSFTESTLRGARMLHTALGPAITSYLEDPDIIEVMLNPDGRLWVDRLGSGLCDTKEIILALVLRFIAARHASLQSCQKVVSVLKAYCRQLCGRQALPFANQL